jgi:phosphoribosylanthranilate isomerase
MTRAGIGRTRVKICGLTREADVQAVGELGADAVGLVFYEHSVRAVGIEQACQLLRAAPAFVTTVGLFVDADPAFVAQVLAQVPLDMLQFHGDEPPAYCGSFSRPWLKAVRMRPGTNLDAVADHYSGASALLLDTFDPTVPGGSGRRFDWDLVPSSIADRIILAGGLTPENVAEAVRRVRPYGVDVSGGVESAKGRKDRAKMAAFVQGVRDGDESR